MAERPSASSTQEGSYFVFFMVAPQAGQLGLGFWQETPHAEQMYSSARKRCVRRIQWACFMGPSLSFGKSVGLFQPFQQFSVQLLL